MAALTTTEGEIQPFPGNVASSHCFYCSFPILLSSIGQCYHEKRTEMKDNCPQIKNWVRIPVDKGYPLSLMVVIRKENTTVLICIFHIPGCTYQRDVLYLYTHQIGMVGALTIIFGPPHPCSFFSFAFCPPSLPLARCPACTHAVGGGPRANGRRIQSAATATTLGVLLCRGRKDEKGQRCHRERRDRERNP